MGEEGVPGSGAEPEARVGLGRLQELVDTGRCSWWRARGQAQVRENLDDHCGIFNGRDECQGAAELRTGGANTCLSNCTQLRQARVEAEGESPASLFGAVAWAAGSPGTI